MAFEITHDQDSNNDEGNFASHERSEPSSAQSRSLPESPLSNKGNTRRKPTPIKRKGTVTEVIREGQKFVPNYPTNEETMVMDTEDNKETGTRRSEVDEDEDEDDGEYKEQNEGNGVPLSAFPLKGKQTPKAMVIRHHPSPSLAPSHGKGAQKKLTIERNCSLKLEQTIDDLMLDDPDDSVMILPATRTKASKRSSTDNETNDDTKIGIPAAKKKRR